MKSERAFFGLESSSKTFLGSTYIDNQLWFWICSHIFLILICPSLGLFLHFLGLLELFLGLGSSSKAFLGPTYIDNQLWFCKYSPNFFVLNLATFSASFALFWALWGYFLVLWGYFWSRGQVQKHIWNLLM